MGWLDIAMKQVGVAELKNNLSRHLREVEGGAIIEVTDHDRPIARLIPIEVKARLVLHSPARPFAEIKDRIYPPSEAGVDYLGVLLEDRRRR